MGALLFEAAINLSSLGSCSECEIAEVGYRIRAVYRCWLIRGKAFM